MLLLLPLEQRAIDQRKIKMTPQRQRQEKQNMNQTSPRLTDFTQQSEAIYYRVGKKTGAGSARPQWRECRNLNWHTKWNTSQQHRHACAMSARRCGIDRTRTNQQSSSDESTGAGLPIRKSPIKRSLPFVTAPFQFCQESREKPGSRTLGSVEVEQEQTSPPGQCVWCA